MRPRRTSLRRLATRLIGVLVIPTLIACPLCPSAVLADAIVGARRAAASGRRRQRGRGLRAARDHRVGARGR